MFQIILCGEEQLQAGDDYVFFHREATCYHLTAWSRAVEKAYGHKPYYLIASIKGPRGNGDRPDKIVGVLPLFHLNYFLFGNSLVSLPFCDHGGIVADDEDVAAALLRAAINLARKLNAALELRNAKKMASDQLTSSSYKVGMVMELNGDSETLWRSFQPKLRSQIRKPEKEGLVARFGTLELLDDFYGVFSYNMWDLGSPVHSKVFIRAVLEEFGESSKLQVNYKDSRPVAAGLIICFRDTVYIPWASSLRKFNSLSPNMMLYWNFLKYAADNDFRKFDFGRSTPGEGTYKFKDQWGAKPVPLYWQYWRQGGVGVDLGKLSGRERYQSLVSVWKRLPLPVANIVGPLIRKHISL